MNKKTDNDEIKARQQQTLALKTLDGNIRAAVTACRERLESFKGSRDKWRLAERETLAQLYKLRSLVHESEHALSVANNVVATFRDNKKQLKDMKFFDHAMIRELMNEEDDKQVSFYARVMKGLADAEIKPADAEETMSQHGLRHIVDGKLLTKTKEKKEGSDPANDPAFAGETLATFKVDKLVEKVDGLIVMVATPDGDVKLALSDRALLKRILAYIDDQEQKVERLSQKSAEAGKEANAKRAALPRQKALAKAA